MDCTFKTERGNFNYRVGLIITNGRKILMARNPNEERAFYYSVGGRVRFGESLTEAALRELKEETGIDCEIDRLAAIHENFFTCDEGKTPPNPERSHNRRRSRRRIFRVDRSGRFRRFNDLPRFLPHCRF